MHPGADAEVCVIGAGMAGLACALDLQAAGLAVTVLEADDRPGGRVGGPPSGEDLLLDRGFQILLTDYPELQRRVDLEALDLQTFEPGARIWDGRRLRTVADPRRRPGSLLATALAPVGSVADKVRLLALVRDVLRTESPDLLRRPDGTTREALVERGFSDTMVERLWEPLFAGIQLDPDLSVSRRRFEVILRSLARGDSAVPADGMQALADQLAGRLTPGSLRLQARVTSLDGTTVAVADGSSVRAEQIVIAAEGPAAASLCGVTDPGSRAVAAWWALAPEPPFTGRAIVLDGVRSGPVKNVAVMSNVSPRYARGRHLIVAAVPTGVADLPNDVESLARAQLRGWFGPVVDHWETVRIDRIAHGQPDQRPPLHPKQRVTLGGGRFVAGDHRDTASIQGALYSGGRAAAAVLAERA
jgi:phytoene dehydrogenase-like protein